jgi:chromosome partitioning protein
MPTSSTRRCTSAARWTEPGRTGSWSATAYRGGFRFLDGLAERAVYREFFARGLTALDPLDTMVLGTRPSLSHVAAQEEVRALLAALRLPIDDRRRRAAARPQSAAAHQPVALHDVLAD